MSSTSEIDASTRGRLIKAAVATIEAEGEAAVKVRDVAALAEVSFASVYHFFGSREGLVIAAQTERIMRWTENLVFEFVEAAKRWSCAADMWRDLDGLIETACTSERKAVRMARTNALGSAMLRPALVTAIATEQLRVGRVLTRELEVAQAKGWLKTDVDLYTFAVWLRGTINARLLVEVEEDGLREPGANGEEWNRITTLAMHAILEP